MDLLNILEVINFLQYFNLVHQVKHISGKDSTQLPHQLRVEKSTRLRSSEGFNVTINTVFLFFAFVSSAFYPADNVPEPLRTAFYLNPLTYLVDVIRAGIFGNITEFVIMEMIVLVGIASILFVIASKLLTKLDF